MPNESEDDDGIDDLDEELESGDVCHHGVPYDEDCDDCEDEELEAPVKHADDFDEDDDEDEDYDDDEREYDDG